VDVPPDVVRLVPPGSIPKTSSGKVRRAATRDLFVRGELGREARTPLAVRARLVAGAVLHELGGRLRTARRLLYAAYLAVAIPLVAVPLWLPAFVSRSRPLSFACARLTCRLILRLAGCPLSAEGVERLRGKGPFILAANHASYADVPALIALLPVDFLFVAKKEVLSYPIVSTYVRTCGHLTVDRWDAQQSVADAGQVAGAIESGRSVLFFPEGTFTAAMGLRPFRLGAFKTAVDTDTPVVPLALKGTRRALRADAWLPRPGPIHLAVGEPVPAAADGWRGVVALRDRVQDAIAAGCGEPRLDLVAAGPERA
jgi:1-acyl-sn-glycerol-3-phosphate acyltransferase